MQLTSSHEWILIIHVARTKKKKYISLIQIPTCDILCHPEPFSTNAAIKYLVSVTSSPLLMREFSHTSQGMGGPHIGSYLCSGRTFLWESYKSGAGWGRGAGLHLWSFCLIRDRGQLNSHSRIIGTACSWSSATDELRVGMHLMME